MNLTLRLLLVVCAALAVALMLRKIRKGQMAIADATFWFLFGLSLLVLAIFPQIAYFFSNLFNVESPSNFVFLYVIAVLFVKVFSLSAQVSQLRSKQAFLTQEVALEEAASKLGESAAAADAAAGAGAPEGRETPCAS